LLLPSLYYRHTLSKDIVRETQANAIGQLNLVHWLLTKERSIESAAQLQQWCQRLGDQLGIRITWVAEGGKVIADSRVPAAKVPSMDNHANRPEIMQTGQQQVGTSIRYSATLDRVLIYAAREIDLEGPFPPGVIRVAVPFSEVKGRFDRLSRTSIFVVLITLIVSIAVSYFLVGQLQTSIRRMIRAAEDIGKGDYSKRIRSSPGKEFSPLAEAINRMAGSIETHIQTITEQKQQLEAILNGMSEGVMVLDSNGRIQTVNRAFSAMIPNPPAMIGRSPLELILSHDLQEACDHVLTATEKSEPQPYNMKLALDRDRVFDVNIVQSTDFHGKVGAIVVFHDISELKRLEKVRQDFVANVSHELRTPLTSIKGYAETLLAETKGESESVRSFLQVILKNANHMSKMVEELLRLATLEASQEPVKAASTDALIALQSAWKDCSTLADAKQIRLENLLSEDGVVVKADPEQLVQVFRNLLENALKYGSLQGTVTVSSELKEEGVIFQVRDDGPGIPMQDQQRIFERFYRVEKDRRNLNGSTGLGLAICRHIVQNHGGRIWVESPPHGANEGSSFFFTLPRR
jgi:two-component system phosphate regulon sensor histidine kinase PhoR